MCEWDNGIKGILIDWLIDWLDSIRFEDTDHWQLSVLNYKLYSKLVSLSLPWTFPSTVPFTQNISPFPICVLPAECHSPWAPFIYFVKI